MNLNLSKSELNLLLNQLQQRLHDLNTNETDQIKSVDLPKSETSKSLKNQKKSTSMFNLDIIENGTNTYPKLKSQHFSNFSKVANGKSLSNLIQEKSELLNQNEVFSKNASLSNTHVNTYNDATFPNNSVQSANFQPRSYRRFVHHANPNFSIESFLNKKQQALEYREQLDRQVEEKQQKMQRQSMLEKIKDAMIDKRINEQQKHLKEEFEADHHFDKNHHKDRAIIESNIIYHKTESLPTISNSKHKMTHPKSSNTINRENNQNKNLELKTNSVFSETNTASASLTHNENQKSIVGNLNNNFQNVHSSTEASPFSNVRNVYTQTDDSLLFNLIHDFMSSEPVNRNKIASSVKQTVKTSTKPLPQVQTKITARGTNSTHSSNSKPKTYRKK